MNKIIKLFDDIKFKFLKGETKMKRKYCWLAKEYKRGWRVGLCLGEDKTRYIPKLIIDKEYVEKVLNGNIVYVHMKNSKNEK